MKLVVREAESDALEEELGRWSDLATTVIASIEFSRAVARARTESTAVVADEETVVGVLAAVAEIPLSDDVRATAASLSPVELRTLAAIHLASALALGDELGAVATYDSRMQGAVGNDHGSASPSRPGQQAALCLRNVANRRVSKHAAVHEPLSLPSRRSSGAGIGWRPFAAVNALQLRFPW